MKIGLVIQGPIVSEGFTGQTHGFGKTRAKKELLVKFDTNISIYENISEGIKYFDDIVLATWESDVPKISPKIKKITKVLGLTDPTPAPPSLRKPIKEFRDFHTINTIRQFYSTLEGLEYFFDRGITHAIKIRTDQKIDVKLLYKEFSHFVTHEHQKFFIPFLVPKTPWTIPDFYVGGEIKEFIMVCKAMTSDVFQFHSNVHRDLFFKSILLYSDFLNEIPLKNFFLFQDKVSTENLKMVNYARENIWNSGSRKLYESIVWRGEPVRQRSTDKIFKNEQPKEITAMKQFSRDNVDWDKMLETVTGSNSLTKFIFKVISFKLKRIYIQLRSQISYLLDIIRLRAVINKIKSRNYS